MAIAEKMTIGDIRYIKTTSVLEIDELLVGLQNFSEGNYTYAVDSLIARWEKYIGEDVIDSHITKFKGYHAFDLITRVIHEKSDLFSGYSFSANIKLKIEKKDKEAEKALAEKQMEFFVVSLEDKQDFIKENRKLIEDFMPDGKEISKITLTSFEGDGSKAETVELNAKGS